MAPETELATEAEMAPEAETATETEASLMRMLAKDLRELCYQRGINTLGTKAVLVERLLGNRNMEVATATQEAEAPKTEAKPKKAAAPVCPASTPSRRSTRLAAA